MTNSIDQRIENVRKGIMKRASAMKEKVKKQGFAFKPFSVKQKQVLTWWCPNSPVKDKDGIIADGAIRSGKTLCMSLSYVLWAMESFNQQNFGMAGKTIGSFRRNVLFWVKMMLVSRPQIGQLDRGKQGNDNQLLLHIWWQRRAITGSDTGNNACRDVLR